MIQAILAAAFAAMAPGQTHGECLRSVAAALDRSAETPRDIASATVTACVSAEPQAAPGSLLSQMPIDRQMDVIRLRREMARDEVVLYVVRLRACSKTLACDVRTIP